MSDVPSDILETARKLTLWHGTPFLPGMIVTALWSERERCAAQLEQKARLMRGSTTGDTMARIFEAEAVAMRNAHTLVRSAPPSTPPEGREQTP